MLIIYLCGQIDLPELFVSVGLDLLLALDDEAERRELARACADRYRDAWTSRGRGDGVEAAWRRADAIAATTSCAERRGRSTRSEFTQNKKRDHPRHRAMDTSRIDGR